MPVATAYLLPIVNLLLRGDLLLLTPVALAAASGSPATAPQGGVFSISPSPSGEDITLVVTADGVGAVPTTVTANLLVSDSGQTPSSMVWQEFATAAPLVTAGVAIASEFLHLTAGRVWAIALSALTLGSATGVNIYASIS